MKNWKEAIYLLLLRLGVGISFSRNNFQPFFYDRLDAKSLNRTLLQTLTFKPVVVQNVFPDVDHKHWIHEMQKELKDQTIEYESKSALSNDVEMYECKFSEYLEIYEKNSDHVESLYFMSENILSQIPHLVNEFILPETLFEKNQFDYFPEKIKPKTALIISGEGARSLLHIDPYEWTGSNYLLKGKKLCK
jgi:hypothetical protein